MRSVTEHTLKGSRRCRVKGSSVSLLWEMSRRRRFSRLPARVEKPVHQSVPRAIQNPILQQTRMHAESRGMPTPSNLQGLTYLGGKAGHLVGAAVEALEGRALADRRRECLQRVLRQRQLPQTEQGWTATRNYHYQPNDNKSLTISPNGSIPASGQRRMHSPKALMLHPSRPASTGSISARSDPTIASRRASVGAGRACHIRGEVADPVVQLDDPIVVQVQLLETSQRPELVRDSVELVVAARRACTMRIDRCRIQASAAGICHHRYMTLCDGQIAQGQEPTSAYACLK
jgi:hypothetical protein